MLSIENLDLAKISYDNNSMIIPFTAYPSARVRVDSENGVAIEYAQVNYFWNDIAQQEEEEWIWRRAYSQPDVEEQNMLVKELERYAENETVLQSQVC